MLDTNTIDWLRQCWLDVDVAAVEKRFGVTYQYPAAPEGDTNPEWWRVNHARSWIADQRHRIAPRQTFEVLAKRLVLAMLEPDTEMRDFYVELVRADCNVHELHFNFAVQAAKEAAAQYKPQQKQHIRRRLLAELDEMVTA